MDDQFPFIYECLATFATKKFWFLESGQLIFCNLLTTFMADFTHGGDFFLQCTILSLQALSLCRLPGQVTIEF